MTIANLASPVLVLLLLCGWAQVGRLANRAPGGRPGMRWMLLVTAPSFGGAIEIALSIARVMASHGAVDILGIDWVNHSGHPLLASVLALCWDVVAVATLLSVFGIVIAARRADLQLSDLRGGVWLAQITAVVLFVVALAAVAWGIGVSHQPPIPRADLLGSGPGTRPWTGVETSIAAEWPLVAGALAAISFVTGWAAAAARAGYGQARKLLESTE